jgi:hypothetical protein
MYLDVGTGLRLIELRVASIDSVVCTADDVEFKWVSDSLIDECTHKA